MPDEQHQSFLRWALEQARRELLDLTRRNRLLHAPLSGKRPWCMALSGHLADELLEKLHRQENFRGYAFSPRQDNASDESDGHHLPLPLEVDISSSSE
jgi:hypothetical protein